MCFLFLECFCACRSLSQSLLLTVFVLGNLYLCLLPFFLVCPIVSCLFWVFVNVCHGANGQSRGVSARCCNFCFCVSTCPRPVTLSLRFFGASLVKVTRSGGSSRAVSPVTFVDDLSVGTLVSASLPVHQPLSFDDLSPISESTSGVQQQPNRAIFVRTASEPGTDSSVPTAVESDSEPPSTFQRLRRRSRLYYGLPIVIIA